MARGATPKKGKSAIRRVKVMISSRCDDPFPSGSSENLTETRRKLKKALQDATLFGQQLFEVWINEDAPAPPSQDSWDACMRQVDASDILLVLSNGNAGWTVGSGDVGICHGELERGVSKNPGKVHLIQLGERGDVARHARLPDQRFQQAIERSNVFRSKATTVEDLLEETRQTVLHAVVELVGLGVAETRRGQFYFGEALEWSKLDFVRRGERICHTLGRALVENGGARVADRTFVHEVEGQKVFFVVHAVPGAMSVGAAREMVGRPFLRDHEQLSAMGDATGPVHLIGCNRTATETQAANLLGFPDAAVIDGPFGIYVADDLQKVQFVLLENCRDETLTRLALQRFVGWLEQSGEGALLAKRAAARKRIVQVVDAERR